MKVEKNKEELVIDTLLELFISMAASQQRIANILEVMVDDIEDKKGNDNER